VVLQDTAFSQLDVYDDTALLTLNTPAAQQQQQQAQASQKNGSSEAGGAGGRGAAFELPAAASPAGGSAAAAAAGAAGSTVVSAGLVVDALGSFSPMAGQARAGQAPEAAMLLVGSCVEAPQQDNASSSSSSADVLWGWTPIDR
jgi:hypothetical protein